MVIENKPMTDRDWQQGIRKSYNDANATLGVDGFLTGAIGRRIVKTNTSATVETYTFYEDRTTLLYAYQITYTDATKADLAEVERTA
jgi:hypothetical protein